jgi:hypothetical protein
MKTTTKLSLLAAAFLLMLAGCTNNFTSTDPSNKAFAKNVENGANGKILKVERVAENGKYTDGASRVTVTFSYPVDLQSAKDSITFTKLKTVTNATDPVSLEAKPLVIPMDEVTGDKNNTKELHFKFPATEYNNKFFVKVVGATLKAASTDQKMDQDEDGVQGEKDDDTYGKVFDLGSPVGTYGIDYLDKGANNETISDIFDSADHLPPGTNRIAFKRGLKADYTSDVQLHSYVTHIAVSNAYDNGDDLFSVKKYGITKEIFEQLVKDHIVVEQYVGNKWEKVNTDFKYVSSNTSSLYRQVVSAITVNENVPIRAKVVNINKLSAASTLYKYTLKYTLNATHDNSEALLTKTSGRKLGFGTLPASTLDIFSPVAGLVEVEFTIPSTFQDAVYDTASSSSKDVMLKVNTDGYIDGYKGFDTATLTRESFVLKVRVEELAMRYTSRNTFSHSGITSNAKLDGISSLSLNEQPVNILNVTSFTNSMPNRYYAGTVNKFSLYYDDAGIAGLPVEKDKLQKLEWDTKRSIFNSIQSLYNDVQSHTKPFSAYGTEPLTKAFYQELKRAGKSDNDIQQFIHHVLQNIINDGWSDFTSAGELTRIFPLDIYISPKVQTASFNGIISGSTTSTTIPALNFSQPSASTGDALILAGWAKKSIN